MDSMVFTVSNKTITSQKRVLVALAIILALIFPVSLFFTPFRLKTEWLLGITAVSLALSPLIVFLSYQITKRTWQSLEVVLSEQGIERKIKGESIQIAFNKITRLLIQETKAGEVISLQIYSPDQSVTLTGLDNMNLLAAQLAQSVHSQQVIQRKRAWTKYGGVVVIGSVVLFLLLFLLLMQEIGWQSIFVLQALIFTIQGIYFLTYKPYSRSGSQTRKWEITIGVVMLIFAPILIGGRMVIDGTAVLGIWPCGWFGIYVQQSGCVDSFDRGEYVAFTSDGKDLIRDNFTTIPITPLNGWEGIWTPNLPHDDFVSGFQQSQDGRILLSWTYSLGAGDEEISLWDMTTRSLIRHELLGGGDADHLALSPNGRILAKPWLTQIELWDVAHWENYLTLEGGYAVAFSPDSTLLAAPWGLDIVLWDTQDGHEVQKIAIPDEFSHLTKLAFSPNGKWIAAAVFNEGVIFVWDVATGRLVHDWREEEFIENESIAFSPDSNTLVAGYSGKDVRENYVKLWSVTDGTLLKKLPLNSGLQFEVNSFAFSPDSQLLAIGTRKSAMVFDVAAMIR